MAARDAPPQAGEDASSSSRSGETARPSADDQPSADEASQSASSATVIAVSSASFPTPVHGSQAAGPPSDAPSAQPSASEPLLASRAAADSDAGVKVMLTDASREPIGSSTAVSLQYEASLQAESDAATAPALPASMWSAMQESMSAMLARMQDWTSDLRDPPSSRLDERLDDFRERLDDFAARPGDDVGDEAYGELVVGTPLEEFRERLDAFSPREKLDNLSHGVAHTREGLGVFAERIDALRAEGNDLLAPSECGALDEDNKDAAPPEDRIEALREEAGVLMGRESSGPDGEDGAPSDDGPGFLATLFDGDLASIQGSGAEASARFADLSWDDGSGEDQGLNLPHGFAVTGLGGPFGFDPPDLHG